MKKIFIFSILFGFTINNYAQEVTQNTEQQEKIAESVEALKIAYITKDLNLSVEEAQQFWPVYNNFSSEIKKARNEFKDDDIAFEEKRVAIMKKYRESFRKVFNDENKVKRCFKAEPEFHRLLKREWLIRQGRKHQLNRPNNIKPGAIRPRPNGQRQ